MKGRVRVIGSLFDSGMDLSLFEIASDWYGWWLAQSHICMPVDLVYFLHKVAILVLNKILKQQENNKGVFRQSISLVQIYVGL